MTMATLWIHITLLYIITQLSNAKHKITPQKTPFHYKGWGWTPNLQNIPGHAHTLDAYNNAMKVTSECTVTIANATFNLAPLHLNDKSQIEYYTVNDERSIADPNDDYKYAFNVCGPVLSIPDGCQNAQGRFCEDNNLNENGTCNVNMTHVGNHSVYAYQMKLTEDGAVDRCWHLSDTVGGPGVWSLINENNPAEGVTVSYLDGDYEDACGHNRQINISFICDNDHGAIGGIGKKAKSEIDYAMSLGNIMEEEICQYKLEFRTVYGCPRQCPLAGSKICNGVGLCGYDNTLMQPRCYCLTYFSGRDCQQINMAQVFRKPKDPITANLSSPFVRNFTHWNDNLGKKKHSVNVVYDLSEFHTNKSKPYVMNDIDGIVHTYVWNFMGELDFDIVIDSDRSNKTLEELGCKASTGYCKDLNGDCDTSTSAQFATGGGFVYQIDFDSEECVVAGGKTVDWQLYDEDNPARGVVLTYTNGDYCTGTNVFDGTQFKKNRQFEITLLCPDDTNEYLPLSEESQRVFDAFVEEDDFDFCNYHVSITTAFACPDECLTDASNTERTDDVSVCSAHGLCAADPFSGFVHCLCDNGWSGDYCDKVYIAPPPPFRYKNQGSYVAAIAIISVLLIAIIYFGYKRISSQKQKVKELEIKLVNYQSSGGGAQNVTYHDEVSQSQGQKQNLSSGPSLSDKIKDKFGRNKKGKYANVGADEASEDEQELFNVKVRMNGRASAEDSESDEENDDEAHYHQQQHIIGDDEESNDDSQNDSDHEQD